MAFKDMEKKKLYYESIKVIVKCNGCGKEWKMRNDHAKTFKGLCTSCHVKSMWTPEKKKEYSLKNIGNKHGVGRIISEEHKEKIRKRHIGKVVSKETKDKVSKANKGKLRTEEQRKKISESLKGNKRSKGRVLTQEHKDKVSIGLKMHYEVNVSKNKERKNPNRSGLNAYNWKGGTSRLSMLIRDTLEVKDWRNKCYKRDNYTCCKCGIKGGKLNCHHINTLSNITEIFNIKTVEDALKLDIIHDITNGVTLCKDCHKKIHFLS